MRIAAARIVRRPLAAGGVPRGFARQSWAVRPRHAPGAPAFRPCSSDTSTTQRFVLNTEYCLLPHPAKAAKGGEDACFATSHAVGVADGVGGWAQRGVDAGLYSGTLMREAQSRAKDLADTCPVALLHEAYEATQSTEDLLGTTTACVVTLCDSGTIRGANLGDSGFMLFRPDPAAAGGRGGRGPLQLLFRSEDQQHSFNFPFQLGTDSSDRPADSATWQTQAQTGDVLLLATDGLFDNMFDKDITALLTKIMAKDAQGEDKPACVQLAQRAHHVACQRNCECPFSAKAREEGIAHYGGKMDDITVLIATVVVDESVEGA